VVPPGGKVGVVAGASVLVCVAVAAGQPVQDAVAAALAPFEMWVHPDGRWDRWRLDGGSLPVRAGCADDPRLLRPPPPEEATPGRCAGAPRGLLDFDPERAAARERAAADWARWHGFASR
jgi:hypothetical protein